MDRIIAPELIPEEIRLDTTLRPKALEEFIGQTLIKENLRILLGAAKVRKEPAEHILMYGNPGLGKTTLAYIIANEMGTQTKVTAGPALERVGDLAAILTNLQDGDILFIDEIHRMNKTIEEILYPAMEEYALDIIIGKGPMARTLRMNLPRFTLVGATTKMSLLSSPLRDRFGATYHLDFYTEDEIAKILARNSALLNVDLADDARALIASRARRTPRVANRILKRVRDFAQMTPMDHGHPEQSRESFPNQEKITVTAELAKNALLMLEIDHIGLDRTDRTLLKAIIEKFNGGPVGANTLAAAIAEEEETITALYEPFLMQIGFLARTPKGRMATDRAYRHLGIAPPRLQQELEIRN